jgi:iduronate 2-sulfatase
MKTIVCSLLLLVCCASNRSIAQSQQKKPNVIMITIDDMSIGFDAYGNPDVPMPNFARLMQHGTMFRTAYCQYALCSPSRTSVWSGKRPNTTGVFNDGTDIRTNLGANYKFLPEYLNSNGYYTGKFGKFTCGHEDEISWNYQDAVTGDGIKDISGTPYWWIDTANKTPMATTFGKYAANMISRMQQGTNSPYFYAVGLSTHNQFSPTLVSWNKIGDPSVQQLLPVDIDGTTTNVRGNGSANITLPNTPANDGNDIPDLALKGLSPYPPDQWKNIRHAFYGEMVDMDAELGAILDEIDRENAWDNTIVVLWADHGIQTGEHNGLWFKQTIFEGCLRIPFVICAPGKTTGIHDSPVEAVDIYSTVAELCGLPIPSGQEGSSLVPLLEKQNVAWKKAGFAQVRRVDRSGSFDTTLYDAVRTTRYHYNNWKSNGEELYDIANDPNEFTNLVGNASYASVLDTMRNLLTGGWQNALPPKYKRSVFYKDNDGDGYGTRTDTVTMYFARAGYISTPGDCDDTNPNVNPGANERPCNGIDDNCNGQIDENKVLPVITASGSLDICAAGSVTLSTKGGATAQVQWKRNGVNITNATRKNYRAKTAGSYTVMVTNTNTGCVAESVPTVVTNSCGKITLNIADDLVAEDALAITKLSLYPNPSNGNIIVTYNAKSSANLSFKVYDVLGRVVFSKETQASKSVNTYRFDLSKLNPGMYYLEVNDNGVKQRIKFIIQ